MTSSLTTDRWLELLDQYIGENGHALVNTRHIQDGHRLGAWVDRARRAKKQQKMRDSWLTPVLIAQLESRPGWVWSGNEAVYLAGFNALVKFNRAHGHCYTPLGTIVDGVNLDRWTGRRDDEFKNRSDSRRSEISDDRRAALEALTGWAWSGMGRRQAAAGITAAR